LCYTKANAAFAVPRMTELQLVSACPTDSSTLHLH